MIIRDVAIIGAGIAGASIASEIGGHCSVVLLEAEDQPGYHATGRSAAFWTESYGGPMVQPLTTASFPFLDRPPADFAEKGFLHRRGALNIAREDQAARADRFVELFADSGVKMTRWDRSNIAQLVPDIRADWTIAIFEPDCCDIDVAGLHQAYLQDARRKGVEVQTRMRVDGLDHQNGVWTVSAGSRQIRCRKLINAAGAWADEIAGLAGLPPLGISPKQRTMVQLETDPPSDPDLPLVVALDGSFYFKPEAGGSYWLSPHDEIPAVPGDVAPEELDVAVAIDRFEQVMDVKITRVSRKWAGLRSFAPDRRPVYGFDPLHSDFFWFAGQGGFGIQTAPAAAMVARSLFLGSAFDDMVSTIDAGLYDPARFDRR